MRIITGIYKGRRLEMPVGYDIRPTTEKVKEAIFSTIQAYTYDAVCVDLFTGTGNLGLEALSRGARKCFFCDNSRDSISIARRNIAMCGADQNSVVIVGSYEKALESIHARGEKADVIFLDPPYREGLYDNCFKLISELDVLADDGIIVAEHDSHDSFPDEYAGFEKIKDKTYGHIAVTVYEKPEEDDGE